MRRVHTRGYLDTCKSNIVNGVVRHYIHKEGIYYSKNTLPVQDKHIHWGLSSCRGQYYMYQSFINYLLMKVCIPDYGTSG